MCAGFVSVTPGMINLLGSYLSRCCWTIFTNCSRTRFPWCEHSVVLLIALHWTFEPCRGCIGILDMGLVVWRLHMQTPHKVCRLGEQPRKPGQCCAKKTDRSSGLCTKRLISNSQVACVDLQG